MKVIFGTHNPSKLSLYRTLFAPYDINVVGLNDIDCNIDVVEDGATPHDNAILKAVAYSKALECPVVADDSGLFFEGVPDEIQPRSYVRRVNNRVLSDSDTLDYYTSLVEKYGVDSNDSYDEYSTTYKKLVGYYAKSVAICIDQKTYSCDYKVYKYFINRVAEKKNTGFPMDSMSITPKYNKLTINLTEAENQELITIESRDLVEAIKSWADLLKNRK